MPEVDGATLDGSISKNIEKIALSLIHFQSLAGFLIWPDLPHFTLFKQKFYLIIFLI